MENYLLYVAIASATIASPGPGVVLTITNTIKYGFTGALYSIFGVAIGMLSIATISATGLAVILATSAVAFTILKFIGAFYLIYLGIKMWRSSATLQINDSKNDAINKNRTVTFSVLVMVIHSTYAFFAQTVRAKLSTPKGSRLLNKISGVCYTCFGIGLATTSK